MKKISLTQNEVNDLIDLYQTEIDRAQRRIVNLKAILKKIDEGKSLTDEDNGAVKKVEKTDNAEPKKRGRKPKIQKAKLVEKVASEPKKRGRKPKVKEESVALKKAEKPTIKKAEKSSEKKTKKVIAKKSAKPAPKKAEKVVTKKIEKPAKKRGRKPKPARKSIKVGKGEEKVKWIDLIYDILRTKKSLMLSNSLTLAAMERLNIPDVDKDRVRMAISTNLTRLTKYDKTINKYSQEGTTGSFYGLKEWFDDKGKLKSEFKNKLM